jgi:hypothetical protein
MNLINPRAAYEEAYAAAMLALAKKEGHTGTCFRPAQDYEAKHQRTRKAGEETVMMVSALTERNASTLELAKLAGISPDSASWRLRGLWRGKYVDMVGTAPSTGQGVQTVWALGPRGKEWLERYGVTA